MDFFKSKVEGYAKWWNLRPSLCYVWR